MIGPVVPFCETDCSKCSGYLQSDVPCPVKRDRGCMLLESEQFHLMGDAPTRALSAALEYARRVWPVVPIHTPGSDGLCTCGAMTCESPGKHPRTRNGLLDATVDRGQIREWWRRWPNANVGVVTGPKSGIFVVDVDARSGGFETLERLEAAHGDLTTLSAQTGGGGLHLVFRYPRGATISSGANVLGPGIDIKGDGGYIVVAPSLHASGDRYAWRTVDGILTPEHFPMDPPDWLLEKLAGAPTRSPRQREGSTNHNPPFEMPGVIETGGRNATLMSVAGVARRYGAGEQMILQVLRKVNATRCRVPLDDSELARIAASAARYPAGGSRSVGGRA